MLKWSIRIVIGVLAFLVLSLVTLMFYIRWASSVEPPTTMTRSDVEHVVTEIDTGLYVIGNNWFRRSESGLYELYVEGAPFERGVRIGALTQQLAHFQEECFVSQIRQMIPSETYLTGLKFFVGWFTRDLPDHVDEEYKLEIYGISQFSSEKFNDIVPDPYQRILNYHAAHDIGHALQNMSLVGCTSFATWDEQSEDSVLTIGRNFDFYVGEEFSKNKIVAFYNPESGHKFMTVTFGGMAGVLSGMNVEGLTVTINSAKSDIPSSAATPVSLVAREILQYASTIDEAYAIAQKRKMFVAESFLIGSAKDGRAVVIEKTADAVALFESPSHSIVCTNHFQSKSLGNTQLNREHMEQSASPYRHQRVEELIDLNKQLDVSRAVSILRNSYGIKNDTIGYGNEKTVNQFLAHHGIVFQPEKKLVWVSTAPWQLGKFVCYDLSKVFNLKLDHNQEVYEKSLVIPADTALVSHEVQDFLKGAKYRLPFAMKTGLNPDSLVKWNPQDYYTYILVGDFYYNAGDFDKALLAYETGLQKEIANQHERDYLKEGIQKCNSAKK